MPKQESDFSKDLIDDKTIKDIIDEYNNADKDEFLREIKLDDIEKAATNIKRKEFEEKKGIKYEPEIIDIPKPEQKIESNNEKSVLAHYHDHPMRPRQIRDRFFPPSIGLPMSFFLSQQVLK